MNEKSNREKLNEFFTPKIIKYIVTAMLLTAAVADVYYIIIPAFLSK